MNAAGGGDGAAQRTVTEVAVGVLLRADDAVLLADRPAGKPYAGYWEFPGGKVEPGESIEHALQRELHEELGVDIASSTPWVTFEYDYPHAYVRLHFRRIYDWRGTPRGREGQRLAFVRLHEPAPQPLLPAAVPALRWLALPGLIAEAVLEPGARERQLAHLDRALAQGVRMVSIRNPELRDAASTRALVQDARIRAEAVGAIVTVSSGVAACMPEGESNAPGLIIDEVEARSLASRPSPPWVGVRTTSRAVLLQAARLGVDFAIAGPVLPDAIGEGVDAIGWHGFTALADQAPVPVYASGGLDPRDLARARLAGAHGLALPLEAW